ncbi:MAG: triphosphoribosyl-dephospho-CoA synthase [Pseudomonadota bacterium]
MTKKSVAKLRGRALKQSVATDYLTACRFDVIAAKPGNVSVNRPGHDMVANQFLSAARASAKALAKPQELGEAIFSATEASVGVAGCNTNLGIVLLAAPLMQARFGIAKSLAGHRLREATAIVIENSGIQAATAVYAAIQLAEPGGLGRSEQHDVAEPPSISLFEAMQFAAGRDRIAYQYVTKFVDVFTLGVPIFRHYLVSWESFQWASVAVYLSFLATFKDTHIERKFGHELANDVMAQAAVLERNFKACENPAEFAPSLQSFDAKLKRGGINPGTSADLTVASLLAHMLQTSI